MTLTEAFGMPEYGRMYKSVGIEDELRTDEDGHLCATMPVTMANLNSNGVCQGGAIFSLCDAACGAFCRIHHRFCVTLDGAIRYYNPARKGKILTAAVQERKIGNTVTTLVAVVRDNDGLLIADFASNFVKVDHV